MSADKLVFDLSQEIEGSPQVFIKKDFLSILDNMNTNYNSNQTIIDTSQLSNSNKYMSYREAYLAVPLLLTLSTPTAFTLPTAGAGPIGMSPQGTGVYASLNTLADAGISYPVSCDYAIGLKNWFGSIFHSITLDMNGTTIIQQTPLINMVNSFRLLTTLSWGDVISQGATIGFYPDSATSWTATGTALTPWVANPSGQGICNNTLFPATDTPYQVDIDPTTGNLSAFSGSGYAGVPTAAGAAAGANKGSNFAGLNRGAGNKGFLKRIQNVNVDALGPAGWTAAPLSENQRGGTTVPVGEMLAGGTAGTQTMSTYTSMWNSYIFKKADGLIQTNIMATVYLKHLHNFFAMCPLLKGTFFKLTCFLNNASVTSTISGKTFNGTTNITAANSTCGVWSGTTSSVPVGGICPIMLADTTYAYGGAAGLGNATYTASLAVGGKVLATHNLPSGTLGTGLLGQSIYLYVPSYTFNPVFENAYLSSPIKSIKYSDYYQYQVIGVGANQQFNNLLTNGIANIKSVLIIPFYSASSADGAQKTGLPVGMPVYQSPFDTAGTGTTSPLVLFNNFNVVVSGQNAIYNTERYAFEQFNNQFKGINSVNGDMTDGLTSGLIGSQEWLQNYCYWYVNVARMLPVEESVPKSVQIIGQNMSAFAMDLICFIEYGCSIDCDALTGARV